MDGGCGAEDYLILQLRLRKGLDLAAYKARYGKEFSTAQLAFVKNCVKSGYATFDGSTLALTPAGSLCRTAFWQSCCKRLSGHSHASETGHSIARPIACGNRSHPSGHLLRERPDSRPLLTSGQ